MLYDNKAFYVFVSDDEYLTKKMYYKSNELNGRLIISYYKLEDDIVIKINYPNKEILSKEVDLSNYELITKYYIERMESDGYEVYPTTYEKVYGLGTYKKFFVPGLTPDMSCIEKYLEYDYLEYDELDKIAENKKELEELQSLYNRCLDFDKPEVVIKKFNEYDKNYKNITQNFKDEEFLN